MESEWIQDKLDLIKFNVKWLVLLARDEPKTLGDLKHIDQAKECILNAINEIEEIGELKKRTLKLADKKIISVTEKNDGFGVPIGAALITLVIVLIGRHFGWL